MSKPPMIEAWHPTDPAFASNLVEYQKLADTCIQNSYYDYQEADQVNLVTFKNLDCLLCIEADPHTDETFKPWSILWVIRTNQHTLFTNNQKYPFRSPAVPKAKERLPLETGQLVVFNIHKMHWVKHRPDMPAYKQHWLLNRKHTEKGYQMDDKATLEFNQMVKPDFLVVSTLDLDIKPSREEAEVRMVRKFNGEVNDYV